MEVENLADVLPIYYNRFFPYNDFCRWLSYGNNLDLFSRREFSFTLKNDTYIRFNSFKNAKELELGIKRLIPFKIDIGAIYNCCPKDRSRTNNFRALERELVFDIDMDDYDDVRTCCNEKDICSKCWKFMGLACKILDTALRSDFGFKHILWVFSGRRGIHCWVCDSNARALSAYERSGVAEYLRLVDGGSFKIKKVEFTDDILHHSVKRAVEIIEPFFVEICVEEQNILGTDEGIEKFLLLLPYVEDKKTLEKDFSELNTSKDRWNAFLNYVQGKKRDGKWFRYRYLVEEVMLQYSYPRLDVAVTKGKNHLLKAPFCVHPKTGKICIPFSVNTVDKFQLDNVPTIESLIAEINEFDLKDKAENMPSDTVARKIKDYKKTSLNKSLHVFHEFLWNLELERKEKRATQSSASSLDF